MPNKLLWDLPTRLCHWLFVVAIAFSWWSAENDHFEWHTWSGYSVLTLVIFRIVWGLVGSESARFSHFLHHPASFIRYAKTLFHRDAGPALGHNPMGGWSVVLLLSVMLAQVLLGLFSEDVDGLASGPLSYLVSYDTTRWAAETHEELFDFLVVLIAIHIAFVMFYVFYKKDNLIKPMITGTKASVDVENLKTAPLWLAAIVFALSAGLVWWLIS